LVVKEIQTDKKRRRDQAQEPPPILYIAPSGGKLEPPPTVLVLPPPPPDPYELEREHRRGRSPRGRSPPPPIHTSRYRPRSRSPPPYDRLSSYDRERERLQSPPLDSRRSPPPSASRYSSIRAVSPLRERLVLPPDPIERSSRSGHHLPPTTTSSSYSSHSDKYDKYYEHPSKYYDTGRYSSAPSSREVLEGGAYRPSEYPSKVETSRYSSSSSTSRRLSPDPLTRRTPIEPYSNSGNDYRSNRIEPIVAPPKIVYDYKPTATRSTGSYPPEQDRYRPAEAYPPRSFEYR